MRTMIVRHPVSGVRKQVLGRFHDVWSFLFGPYYYLAKGMLVPALLSLFTLNGLLLIVPLWNETIVRGWYERAGWIIEER